MLEGLDDVPWSELHHAYGTAEDVPGLLQALAGAVEEREAALHALYGSILHQGTIYEASAYAVPFLVELAATPSLEFRDAILGLIGALASDEDEGDGGSRHAERTRRSVLDLLDIILELLGDPAPEVRAGAAFVASRFRGQTGEIAPRLRDVAVGERDSLAKAGIIWCLASMGDSSIETAELIDATIAEASDPRVALAAAVASYRIEGARHPTAGSLYAALAAAPWFSHCLSYLSGLRWDASTGVELYGMLDGVTPDRAAASRMLLAVLDAARNPGVDYASIVHDLLDIHFEGGAWHKVKRLDDSQARVLRRLVARDEIWADYRRLWRLVPGRKKSLLELTSADLQAVRDAMRDLVERSGG